MLRRDWVPCDFRESRTQVGDSEVRWRSTRSSGTFVCSESKQRAVWSTANSIKSTDGDIVLGVFFQICQPNCCLCCPGHIDCRVKDFYPEYLITKKCGRVNVLRRDWVPCDFRESRTQVGDSEVRWRSTRSSGTFVCSESKQRAVWSTANSIKSVDGDTVLGVFFQICQPNCCLGCPGHIDRRVSALFPEYLITKKRGCINMLRRDWVPCDFAVRGV